MSFISLYIEAVKLAIEDAGQVTANLQRSIMTKPIRGLRNFAQIFSSLGDFHNLNIPNCAGLR